MLNITATAIRTLSCAALLLLLGCATPVSYQGDYSTATDFSNYKTYRWHRPNTHNQATQAYLSSDIVDERIRQDINQQLENKGFIQKEDGPTDFLVNYTVTVDEDLEVHTYNTYDTDFARAGYNNFYGYRGAFGSPYRSYSAAYPPIRSESRQRIERHKVGTLIIDIIQTSGGQLVWRGTAEGELDKAKVTAEQRDQQLNVIIEKTLYDFPPKAQ